ncbi:hypothetical protein Sjap_022352 [Stephania japonica]|uniref:Glutamine amidotransferase domain-containing protein n=1 Tax=Stephania japonica TaxID=461633 RepID=A0AAP0HUY5_9MAGN
MDKILVRAIGGKTGRVDSGWDLGVTTINFEPSKLMAFPCIPSSLPVIECHRDEVIEMPEGAEVMARSSKTRVEMFRYRSHIMGIQGHPEYTKDILFNILDRLCQRNLIQESQAVKAKNTYAEASELEREAWKRLCRSFLKGHLLF